MLTAITIPQLPPQVTHWLTKEAQRTGLRMDEIVLSLVYRGLEQTLTAEITPPSITPKPDTLWANTTTPAERAQSFLAWVASLSQQGLSLPDSAFDRATIYE